MDLQQNMKNYANNRKNINTPEWVHYNDYKSTQLDNYNPMYHKLYTHTSNDQVARPTNTGIPIYITLENKFIQSKIYWNNLMEHIFRNRRFIGEQVNFYKSKIGKYLVFDSCQFEYVDVWQETNDVNEIKQILKDRQLEGNNTV